MVVWVCFMLRNLIGVLKPDSSFGLLLTDSWIKLTQLRSLTNSVTLLLKKMGRLYRSFPGRSPYCQHFQWNVCSTAIDHSFYITLSTCLRGKRHCREDSLWEIIGASCCSKRSAIQALRERSNKAQYYLRLSPSL